MNADPLQLGLTEQKPRHVVVVDDDPMFLRFVVRVLENQHFRVSAAEGFSSAIKIIESDEPVDLLLTDVGLGQGSPHGVVLTNMARLRRHRLKVILMSGSYDVRQVAEYAGSATVLQKPFVAQQLIDAVTAALEPSAAA